MIHFLDPEKRALEDWLADRNEPGYRAEQIRGWLFARRASRFEEMTNLPETLRQALTENFSIFSSQIASHSKAEDGTEKLLLELQDRERIECVLLRDGSRRTICISSQVGCAMGCVFCASGLDGVVRNLTAGEMVEQMLRLAALLPCDSEQAAKTERISHIVVMGMGEPLANLDSLLPALSEAVRLDRLGISPRRITISTVGLPAAIHRLADSACKYNLAVSLHAADDELRNRLVPVNQKTGLTEILEAADRYFEVSGRRLTFEYVLLADINDREPDARRLAGLLRGRPAMLNVIPYNPVAGLPYETPSRNALKRFLSILELQGVNVQVRERKGSRIDAACGQLRRIKE